jgi:hypothetical protein
MVKICKCLCDKGIKIFKKFDFCPRLYAEMIENLSVELKQAIGKMVW